jgi:hypothetical protein
MRISMYRLFCCTLFVLSAAGMAFTQDSNFSTGPQYLMNYGSPLFMGPISTPSMSLNGPPLQTGARDATGVLIAGAGNQDVLPPSPDALPKIDLFPIFYGNPSFNVNVVEISFSASSGSSLAALPPSILDSGVWQITTMQGLRDRGYGLTIAEAAARSKAQIRHANRVYTNADTDRLHGGS